RKLDYEIFLWIKNFNDTGSTIYKNEPKLLREFKSNIFKRKKKQKTVKIEEICEDIAEREAIFTDEKISGNYNAENKNSDVCLMTSIRSPEYHPQSPSL
ncbi:8351_t:CDS:1, partial [Cetraspora pellucida]